MVTLNPAGEPRAHYLRSKVHFDGFAEGSLKNLLIQKMSDGRFAVFSQHWQSYFYMVFKNHAELNDAFDEISYEDYQIEVNPK